jgi:hypothetical protein
MTSYNEDIQELIMITKLLHKEVNRLNKKIKTDRISRILNNIPQKTILYNSKQFKNLDINNKTTKDDKILIKFE